MLILRNSKRTSENSANSQKGGKQASPETSGNTPREK